MLFLTAKKVFSLIVAKTTVVVLQVKLLLHEIASSFQNCQCGCLFFLKKQTYRKVGNNAYFIAQSDQHFHFGNS